MTWLALGDSYTIGEGLNIQDTYPFQTAEILRKQGLSISEPLIIAKTGWTTDELQDAIDAAKPSSNYDIVSLLIGVNNQYRGRSVAEYHSDFEKLLKRAIGFAKNVASHVFVLSIPDWGVTGFASGRDRNKIAHEIDQFNAINSAVSRQLKTNYVEITQFTREHAEWVVADQLHPNAKMYGLWAQKLAEKIPLTFHL